VGALGSKLVGRIGVRFIVVVLVLVGGVVRWFWWFFLMGGVYREVATRILHLV
jgi:hypothetical protein